MKKETISYAPPSSDLACDESLLKVKGVVYKTLNGYLIHKTQVKKLSLATVYRIFFIGSVLFFLPVFLLLGIFGSFGFELLYFQDKPVTGIKAVFFGPVMGVVMSLIFTLLNGTICAVGLLFFSFFKSLRIDFYKSSVLD